MKFGMTDSQWKILEETVISPLKSKNIQVFIFGSRARGQFHPHSDVDLLFHIPAGVKLPSGLISQITENIEESKFPFTVDLVNKDELAESYRDGVLSEMIEI